MFMIKHREIMMKRLHIIQNKYARTVATNVLKNKSTSDSVLEYNLKDKLSDKEIQNIDDWVSEKVSCLRLILNIDL